MIVAEKIKVHASALAVALAKEYVHDPFRIGSPDPLSDFNRSLKKMIRSGKYGNVDAQLEKFDKLAGDDPFKIFPTRHELINELLPILLLLKDQYPYIRTGLSISCPVALPGNVSLNYIIRLYNSQKRIGVKIKFSVFADTAGRLYYEVGFVNVSKSLFDFEKNFLEQNAPKGDYHILWQLVNQIKIFIRRRPLVTGMDLTPAYYHVLPLCLRLGGKPQDEKFFTKWIGMLETAGEFSLDILNKVDPHFFQACKHINRRFVISWLFSNGKLFCPVNKKPMVWNPPRLLWFSV